MKLIIPMAGRGTRLRPHSHTTPKPLLPVAGTTIVERIVQTFSRTIDRTVDEIVFVLGDFGDDVKRDLTEMSERQGATASFYKQDVARGTAHAVFCAAEKLEGEVIIVFADTLFDTAEKVTVGDADSVIWLKEVEDPSRFGVAVQTEGRITSFVEKPSEPISNMAIIGVYYFKDGEGLRNRIQYLIDNNITGHGNEYQLTDAIDALLKDGKVFKAATVDEWLDCGTIDAWIETSNFIVNKENQAVDSSKFPGSEIIQPVYIGEGAKIEGSKIGPNASIGAGAEIIGSSVKNSIVLDRAKVTESKLDWCSIGFDAEVTGLEGRAHLGDNSVVKA
ncbi:MAG: NTP transferase domain-containing protein [Balneolales bacterium]|nr:NTP transferase domain-containing protein [Balneolales bacterium]